MSASVRQVNPGCVIEWLPTRWPAATIEATPAGFAVAQLPVRKNVPRTPAAARVRRMLGRPAELAPASKVRATTGPAPGMTSTSAPRSARGTGPRAARAGAVGRGRGGRRTGNGNGRERQAVPGGGVSRSSRQGSGPGGGGSCGEDGCRRGDGRRCNGRERRRRPRQQQDRGDGGEQAQSSHDGRDHHQPAPSASNDGPHGSHGIAGLGAVRAERPARPCRSLGGRRNQVRRRGSGRTGCRNASSVRRYPAKPASRLLLMSVTTSRFRPRSASVCHQDASRAISGSAARGGRRCPPTRLPCRAFAAPGGAGS